MQILGLSESTPQPDNRIKSLFWPRVRYQEDVDYLGSQGYWVCVIIAGFTTVASLCGQSGASLVDALYFYLAGVGIRQRSRFAAITALLVYLLNVIVRLRMTYTPSILSIFFLALLLSNARATWLSASWEGALQEPRMPVRQTIIEKFADVVPRRIWPVGKWILYVLTVLELLGMCILVFGSFAKIRGL
jgi:hypothetical protein